MGGQVLQKRVQIAEERWVGSTGEGMVFEKQEGSEGHVTPLLHKRFCQSSKSTREWKMKHIRSDPS